jgi:hypothetical protein
LNGHDLSSAELEEEKLCRNRERKVVPQSKKKMRLTGTKYQGTTLVVPQIAPIDSGL